MAVDEEPRVEVEGPRAHPMVRWRRPQLELVEPVRRSVRARHPIRLGVRDVRHQAGCEPGHSAGAAAGAAAAAPAARRRGRRTRRADPGGHERRQHAHRVDVTVRAWRRRDHRAHRTLDLEALVARPAAVVVAGHGDRAYLSGAYHPSDRPPPPPHANGNDPAPDQHTHRGSRWRSSGSPAARASPSLVTTLIGPHRRSSSRRRVPPTLVSSPSPTGRWSRWSAAPTSPWLPPPPTRAGSATSSCG